MKIWITARDERVCAECASLDGQVVEDFAFFVLPGGFAVSGPFHPFCRCRIFKFDHAAPQPATEPPDPPIFRWLDFGDALSPRLDPHAITQADRDALAATVKRMAAAAAIAAAAPLDERRRKLQIRPPKPDLTANDAPIPFVSPAEMIRRGLRRH